MAMSMSAHYLFDYFYDFKICPWNLDFVVLDLFDYMCTDIALIRGLLKLREQKKKKNE